MKLISWNVNGLRACMGKGFLEFFKEVDADMFCIQETKMQPGQLELELEGYHQYWCSAQKKGYSGTALSFRGASGTGRTSSIQNHADAVLRKRICQEKSGNAASLWSQERK